MPSSIMDVGRAGQPRRHRRQPARHRLEQRQRIRLADRRQHVDVRRPEVAARSRSSARRTDHVRRSPIAAASLESRRPATRRSRNTRTRSRRQRPASAGLPRRQGAATLGTADRGRLSREKNPTNSTTGCVVGPAERIAQSASLGAAGRTKARGVDAVRRHAAHVPPEAASRQAPRRAGLTLITRPAT